MSSNSGTKLWSLAWRFCSELSSVVDVDPHDVMAAAFLESLFGGQLVKVLMDYFGVDLKEASKIVEELKKRVEEELS